MVDDDGTGDTLHQGVTVETLASTVADGPVEPTARGGDYQVGEVLGRGGMGEVVLARDRTIGRDVALKRMPTSGEASVLPFALAIPFLTIRDWSWLIAFFASILAMLGMSYLSYRRGRVIVSLALGFQMVVVLMFSRLAGPFQLTPILMCGVLLVFTAIPAFNERRWLIIGWSAVTAVLPIVLELIGIIGRTWTWEGDRQITRSAILMGTNENFEAALLVGANTVFIVIVALVARATHRARHTAEVALQIQAWHLRQLLPR
jgi:hypothetical protein